MDWLNRFDSVWSLDFEFSQPPGERPRVVCLVAREYKTRRLIRVDMDTLATMRRPPFNVDATALFVAYFSSAEWNCFLSLGWPLPACVLDLWAEFRCLLNGTKPAAGWGLLGCLAHFGFDSMLASEKQELRELAIRGGPYTDTEMAALLDYCQTDVDALDKLLPAMLPQIDFPRAVHRGRYMKAVACMESAGVPIDVETLAMFRRQWEPIKANLIAAVDEAFGVFEGTTFKQDRFAAYLIRHGIPWPETDSGRLALDDDTFKQQARSYPQVAPLRELRHALSEMKLEKLAVGSDGRNRSMLRPFASRSGRNQPSNNQFIFGPSVWLRGLIRPDPGRAVAYVDWSQQELGIAAALSGDPALAQAYASGDPYLEFAKMAGAVPTSATKKSHPTERSAYKVCMLATQYGMREHGLAAKLNKPVAFARNLLRRHRETFPVFWRWSQQQVDAAMLLGRLETVFGWPIQTIGGDNSRSLANFPMQANGAEMMRLACCLATEAGITVCCPVHDAILIEADDADVGDVVAETQNIMREAASVVLAGFRLESDAKIVRHPERYMDGDRGRDMWERVYELATKADGNMGQPVP
ncbi:DNA polymerase I, thermostable [Crateriforma conspicua]|uniref:DNA polymerase I, thermostable n=1 Tax=Crateriforma conspicua TaxID=2527996 RepID=A0A5C6G1P7_9PLAN|nr:DNA polymerase [Crateriforma conspicua]TWU67578.1 DNA polymerase I, thermostable [Crateriforma conspicua]